MFDHYPQNPPTQRKIKKTKVIHTNWEKINRISSPPPNIIFLLIIWEFDTMHPDHLLLPIPSTSSLPRLCTSLLQNKTNKTIYLPINSEFAEIHWRPMSHTWTKWWIEIFTYHFVVVWKRSAPYRAPGSLSVMLFREHVEPLVGGTSLRRYVCP